MGLRLVVCSSTSLPSFLGSLLACVPRLPLDEAAQRASSTALSPGWMQSVPSYENHLGPAKRSDTQLTPGM